MWQGGVTPGINAPNHINNRSNVNGKLCKLCLYRLAFSTRKYVGVLYIFVRSLILKYKISCRKGRMQCCLVLSLICSWTRNVRKLLWLAFKEYKAIPHRPTCCADAWQGIYCYHYFTSCVWHVKVRTPDLLN